MYTLINSDLTCGGITGTQPNHNNWTLTPYLGGFVKEQWNGLTWVENATPEEIAQANKPIVPQEVPLWAMIRVLKKANVYQSIIDAVNTFDEPLKSDVLDFLALGNFVKRNSQAVLLIQSITQKTNAQVDTYFIDAEALNI